MLDGEPGFRIDYRLENSGAGTIDINHYNHNFTLIDGSPYGPDYVVEFAFSNGEPKPVNDLVEFVPFQRGFRLGPERPSDAFWG